MQATYSDIVKTTGVSKPTVIKVADELDPDKSHRTVENRTTIMDDWLTQAVADKLTKKGLVKQVTPAVEGEAGEDSPVSQVPKKRVVRAKLPSEQEKESIQDTVQQLMDRVLKAEAEKNEMLLKAKDEKIELLTDQVRELGERVEKLDDKVEAERARYDELMELMASEELYADQDKFNAALGEYNGLKQELPKLEDEWLELSTQIEEETARELS